MVLSLQKYITPSILTSFLFWEDQPCIKNVNDWLMLCWYIIIKLLNQICRLFFVLLLVCKNLWGYSLFLSHISFYSQLTFDDFIPTSFKLDHHNEAHVFFLILHFKKYWNIFLKKKDNQRKLNLMVNLVEKSGLLTHRLYAWMAPNSPFFSQAMKETWRLFPLPVVVCYLCYLMAAGRADTYNIKAALPFSSLDHTSKGGNFSPVWCLLLILLLF